MDAIPEQFPFVGEKRIEVGPPEVSESAPEGQDVTRSDNAHGVPLDIAEIAGDGENVRSARPLR